MFPLLDKYLINYFFLFNFLSFLDWYDVLSLNLAPYWSALGTAIVFFLSFALFFN